MATSPLKAKPRDLIVIPEAAPPRRRQPLALIAIVGVLALLIGCGITYAWQLSRVNDKEAARVRAVNDKIASQARAGALIQRVTLLEASAATLEQRLADAKRGVGVVSASKAEVRRILTQTQADLAATRERLATMIGPGLADGRHIGRILAVGSGATPPRLVFDLERYFVGRAARDAAIEDGVIKPGEPLPGNHYIRNSSPQWRILRVSSTALVTLHGYRGVPGPTTVSLSAFERILSSKAAADERVRHDPFWIRISGGQVVAIRQQPYP